MNFEQYLDCVHMTYIPFLYLFLAKPHPCLFILLTYDLNNINKQGYGLDSLTDAWSSG